MTPRKPNQRILAGPVLRAQPDQRLVALAGEGHESAVEEIVRRYRPGLVRFAGSIVRPDRADDVVQDSLARALPRIRAGGDDLRLRPWLYTIVRNTALNQLRDAGPPHAQLDENYDGVEQPPQAMERRERVRSLVAGLQGLPEPQRKALVQREMEGRSHAEIGAEMGVSTGAARQLIFRARHALRTGLGSLVPMPLLRHLAESSDGSAVVAVGGGTVVAKAIALVAAGAVVTAGVEIQHGDRPNAPRAAIADHGSSGRGVTMPATPATRSEAASFKVADPEPRSTHDTLGREAATGSEDHSGPGNPRHEAPSRHDVGGSPHASDGQGGRGGTGLGGGDRSGGGQGISSEGGDDLSSGGGPSAGEEGSPGGESGSNGGEGGDAELSGGDGGGELSSGSGSSSEGSRDSSGSDGFSGTTD